MSFIAPGSLYGPGEVITFSRDVQAFGGYLSDLPDTGTHTNNLPISENEAAMDGYSLAGFGLLDFYNRLHFSEVNVVLGNVVTEQVRTISVWSAFFEQRTLLSVTAEDDEGVEFTPPGALPLTFEPLQQLDFEFSVSTDGPPTVAATYTFSFDSGDVVLSISGSRVTAWTWRADWSRPMVERLEWLTAVMRSYDGSEQRQALREDPRRFLEFGFTVEGRERQFLEAALWSWGARTWAVPFWPDGEQLTATLSAGALTVPVTTTDRDYHVSGLAILMTDPFTYEVVEVESLTSSELTLVRETQQTWGPGTWIYPARVGRLPQSVSVDRFTGKVSRGVARFQFVDVTEIEAATGEATYRGNPVLTHRPNWTEDPRADYERKLSWLDAQTGIVTVDDHSDVPATRQSDRWALTTRAEVNAFRKFLAARRGRCDAIWVPTWADDLTVKATIGAAAVAIDVAWAGYELHLDLDANRKDIRIETRSGTVYYRRITSVSQVDATTERLGIDSALGVEVAAADVVLVSFMALARLDADAVELAHWTGEVAQAAAGWQGFNHDV